MYNIIIGYNHEEYFDEDEVQEYGDNDEGIITQQNKIIIVNYIFHLQLQN